MPYALESKKEETSAPQAEGFAIADLWMLPILLWQLIFDKFRRHLTRLKQMRRSRPMPKDWESFWPELRKCEWAIQQLRFEGARQIILGGELDFSAISFDPEPPDSFQPSMPRSALAMHQRMEDLARFYADPERYIRRHATRVRERTGDDDDSAFPIPTTIPTTTIFQNANPDVPVAIPIAIAIRGPP